MKYTIKTYEEGFIDDQFKIGSAIYDAWPMGGQTRPDQLRKSYETDNFDPSTRFYAFDGDEMVGFLTSSFKENRDDKIVYFFEPPYVKPEHAPKAEIQLLDHAIDQLRAKGVDILLIRAGVYWGKSLHYAEMYDFEYVGPIVRGTRIALENTDPGSFGDATKLVDFDPELHFEKLVSFLAEKFNAPPDKVRPQLETWRTLGPGKTITSPWDHIMTILSHKVLIDGDQIVSRMLAMNHNNFGENTVNLSQVAIKEGYEDTMGDVLASLVTTGKQHNKEYAVLHSGIWGPVPTDELYEKYGLKLEHKLSFYEKSLK